MTPGENRMLTLNMSPRRSLLLVLASAVLSLSSAEVIAATPDQVIEKSQAVRQYLRTRAYQMNPRELDTIDQYLTRILRGANGNPIPGPGPGPRPGYPNPGPGYPNPTPQPQGQCKLLGRGNHGGFIYNYRLALNGQTMEASDDLDTLLGRIQQYRRDGYCGVLVSDVLTLSARGNYGGFTYAFRVMLGGEAIAASDDMEVALAVLGKLDRAGVGRVYSPNEVCQLLPRGNYGGWIYNYRVGVGAEVMVGSDSYATVTSAMQRLRNANICY